MKEHVERHPISRHVLALMLVCLIPASSGCTLLLLGAGAAGGIAGTVYVKGKLETELEAPVPKVQQAAVGSLKSLALPISKQKGDKLAAEVESKTADGKRVWIHVESISQSRSKVTIRVGYMGDENRSRRILDGMRARL